MLIYWHFKGNLTKLHVIIQALVIYFKIIFLYKVSHKSKKILAGNIQPEDNIEFDKENEQMVNQHIKQ